MRLKQLPNGTWSEGVLPGESLFINGAPVATDLFPATAERLAEQWAAKGHTVSIVTLRPWVNGRPQPGPRTHVRRVARPPLRGAGDVVARVTNAAGITPCAPCKRRQATLNRWFPFT
jgi:hypothetical protein